MEIRERPKRKERAPRELRQDALGRGEPGRVGQVEDALVLWCGCGLIYRHLPIIATAGARCGLSVPKRTRMVSG